MAATFVVEDGTGKADANSYMSVADADQYHENNGTKTAWDAVTDKEQALRDGTKFLEVSWKGRWIGQRTVKTQALSWPRANAEDQDGFVIDSNEIPQDLQDALAEAALDSASTDLTADLTAPVGTIKRQRNTVGPLTQDTEYLGGAQNETFRTAIVGKIRNLIVDTDVLERS